MTTQAYFVPSQITFIPQEWAHDGTYPAEKWPNDAVLLTEEETAEYWLVAPPDGKTLGVLDRKPVWVDIPPPTKEASVAAAEGERKRRIKNANEFMNAKQWPGKAAIGRLKDDELAKYNAWLDYLDSLETLNTSVAPYIIWPDQPEQEP